MNIYLVGGAVRDTLLGLAVKDRDSMVVGATETQLLELGFNRVEGAFPVFLHPDTGEEYAMARTEVKTGTGYKGFSFNTGIDVSLEQDLQRRDLTINAIAQNEQGQLIDPYYGQADIDARLLRHITPAFIEDPLRLLRVARFAARFGHLGFHLAHDTFKLMKQMVQTDELASLPAERFWLEMKGALEAPQSWHFFEILHGCGALGQLLPVLGNAMLAYRAHAESSDDVTSGLKRAVAENLSAEGRFAVFILSLISSDAIAEVTDALPLEKSYQEALADLASEQATCALAKKGDAAAILKLIKHCRALQQPKRLSNLLKAYQVLTADPSHQGAWLQQAVECVKAVSVTALKLQELKGTEIGKALDAERLSALRRLIRKDMPKD